MNKKFVSYEQALILKNLGFKDFCKAYYLYADPDFLIKTKGSLKDLNENIVLAPTIKQALNWLIDSFNIIMVYKTNKLNKKAKVSLSFYNQGVESFTIKNQRHFLKKLLLIFEKETKLPLSDTTVILSEASDILSEKQVNKLNVAIRWYVKQHLKKFRKIGVSYEKYIKDYL